MKLGNPKNAFWEAFLLTAVVFILGLFIGITFESGRLEKMNDYYVQSEISLMDILVLSELNNLENISCERLIDSNINLADRVYEEALLLEKYEESGKIADRKILLAHQKYDLLRTFLWVNVMKIKEECRDDFSYVVYLYEFQSEKLTQRATQDVWSKILFGLKQEKGNDIILIPISVDSGLVSLDSLINEFNISKFPAVIINGEDIVYELRSVEEIEELLD